MQKIIIKSNLGGNCRLRVPNEILLSGGQKLIAATGKNPNPFFATEKVKEPLISDSAKLNSIALKSTFVYDIPTVAGKSYTLVCK